MQRLLFPSVKTACTSCFGPVTGFISRLGRTGAFNLSICGWFPCGVLLTSLACTMTHDEDAMQVCVKEAGGVGLVSCLPVSETRVVARQT
jgi:hypothetical protein